MSLNIAITVGTARVTSDKRQTKLSGGNEEKKNEMEYIIVNKNV
jgi:hypothetical protein